ncbi:MAG: nitrate ABC transporter [Sandaracinus sp.]|nr:nitrate ABC transporter [Sandaracinus sp.]
MTHELKIGFVPLTDCATLAMAHERGTFHANGLDVTLKRYVSWAAMRDALGTGAIDAAQMLSPMVVASAAGVGPFAGEFVSAFTLNLNGNAITVSSSIYDAMARMSPETISRRPLSAYALKSLIDQRREDSKRPLTFAHVYPHSMHAMELRYWLAAAGIDPSNDIELVVVPPSLMVDALASGQIDGYCVGEPWNNAAVVAGIGRTVITSGEIWSNGPEKVLAVRKDWAESNHDIHLKLLAALSQTSVFIDDMHNRMTVAQVISSPDYVNAPFDEVVGSLTGKNRQTGGELRVDMPDFNVFHRYVANFPWRSHAKWILSQMIRWGETPENVDVDAVAKLAFRPDIYREAVTPLGVACPHADEKLEGVHPHAWLLSDASQPVAMGPDMFMDGRVFDPSNVDAYVSGFTIRNRESRLGQSDDMAVGSVSR